MVQITSFADEHPNVYMHSSSCYTHQQIYTLSRDECTYTYHHRCI